MSVWSLGDKSITHVRNPKFAPKKQHFSPDKRFVALAERSDCKDWIGIYSTQNWELVSHFNTETIDLEDLMWTPEDSVILVWDTYLEYKLLIYNTVGTLIARHVPYENALGIKTVSLSPDGLLCSIGSYDQQVRIFGYLSWQ